MENPNQEGIAQIAQLDQELNKNQVMSDAIEQTNAGDSVARRTMREMTVAARPGELVPSLSAMEDARTGERATEIAVESAISAYCQLTDNTLSSAKEMVAAFTKLVKETKELIGPAEKTILDASSPMFDPNAISYIDAPTATLIGPDVQFGGDPEERFQAAANTLMSLITNQGVAVDGMFQALSTEAGLADFCISPMRAPEGLHLSRTIGGVSVLSNSFVGPHQITWLVVQSGDAEVDDYTVQRQFASLHAYYDRPRNVEISDVMAEDTVRYYEAMGELGHDQFLSRLEQQFNDLQDQMKTLNLVCDAIGEDLEDYSQNTRLDMSKQVELAVRQVMLFATNTYAICMFARGFFEAIEATGKLLKLTKED